MKILVPPFPLEDLSLPHPLDLGLVESLPVGRLVGESSEALLPVIPGGMLVTHGQNRVWYISADNELK